ncbi:MAG: hypothetical protein AABY68_12775 [Pseudomonadota bacterium]
MAVVIGIILLLAIIGSFSSRNTVSDGAKQIKSKVSQLLPRENASQQDLAQLLAQLHIEGCLYGPVHTELQLLVSPELSRMLQRMSSRGWLEQVLPQIGFSIRSTASIPAMAEAIRHTRLLLTPNGYAIGYTPISHQE